MKEKIPVICPYYYMRESSRQNDMRLEIIRLKKTETIPTTGDGYLICWSVDFSSYFEKFRSIRGRIGNGQGEHAVIGHADTMHNHPSRMSLIQRLMWNTGLKPVFLKGPVLRGYHRDQHSWIFIRKQMEKYSRPTSRKFC